MEETKRKFPSLPPNYVSLQQLQEQRLRKQQQKKEEEEEEEQRLKEEKEKQQQKEAEEEEEKKKNKLLVSQKTQPSIKSYDQTSSIRNGRNFSSQKSWLIKEKNEPAAVVDQKLEEEVESKGQKKKKNNRYKGNGASKIQKGEIEINVDVQAAAEELPLDLDPDQNLKEIKTKKKRKRYKGKKPVVVEEEALIAQDMKEESLPPIATIPDENDADVKNSRTGFRRRRDRKPPPPPLPETVNQTIEIEQKIGDPIEDNADGNPIGNDADRKNTRTAGFRRRRDRKLPPPSPPDSMNVNQTMAIEQKIGDLKICDDDDDEKKKSTVEEKKKKKNDDDDYSYYSRLMRRRKQMDGNLMWIRKD